MVGCSARAPDDGRRRRMTSVFGASLNRVPEKRQWIKAALRSGMPLGFFVVEADGTRGLSHVIEWVGRSFVVHGLGDEPIGRYATFSAASEAGFHASAGRLAHGLMPD